MFFLYSAGIRSKALSRDQFFGFALDTFQFAPESIQSFLFLKIPSNVASSYPNSVPQQSHISNEAVQIFGGYGYSKEFPVEKFYRDAKLCTIGEGTSEIQKVVIAKQILK